jgi:hypothetical protein
MHSNMSFYFLFLFLSITGVSIAGGGCNEIVINEICYEFESKHENENFQPSYFLARRDSFFEFNAFLSTISVVESDSLNVRKNLDFGFERGFGLGLGGGINFAFSKPLQGTFSNSNKLYRLAPTSLVGFKYKFKGLLFLQLDFAYNSMGYSQNQNIADENGNNLGIKKSNWTYEYFQIPFSVGIQTKGRLFFEPNLGIAPSYLNSTVYEMKDFFRLELDVTDRFSFMGFCNLGLGFWFSNHFNFRVYGGFHRNFTPDELSSFNTALRLDYFF